MPKSMDRWTVAAAAIVAAVLAVGTATLAGGLVSAGTVAAVAPGPAPEEDGPLPRPQGAWDEVWEVEAVDGPTAGQPASGTDLGRDDRATRTGAAGEVDVGPLRDRALEVLAATPVVGSPFRVNPWLPLAGPLPGPTAAPVLGTGDEAPEVRLLEQRLAELGYRPGEVDDAFDRQTASAVLAFQKAENLERSGDADAATWSRLAAPQAWSVTATNIYPRVEVDLARQVALVVLGPHDVRTLNTSTGGGYTYRNEHGYLEVAETPLGDHRVYDVYDGTVKAPLGLLYRPLYFVGGYAIHGSPYVPSYPDSHGCVRLSNVDMDWLFHLGGKGMPVAVFETMDPAALFGAP